MSELVFNRIILEKNNRVLSLLMVISLALNVFLVFALTNSFARPPLIVYAKDGQISVLKTKTLGVDEALLKDFIRLIAGQYLSFAGDSLPQQIQGLKPYLAPKPIDAILKAFKDNQAVIEKQNISQQFMVKTIAITKKSNPFWVEVQGSRNIHAAGNDKIVPAAYVFEVKQIAPTETNPYGFLMTDIIEKDKPINKGQTP